MYKSAMCTVGGIYRNHNGNVSHFVAALECVLHKVNTKRTIVLAWDMNIDISKLSNDDVMSYMTTLMSLKYMPYVTVPSRIESYNKKLSWNNKDSLFNLWKTLNPIINPRKTTTRTMINKLVYAGKMIINKQEISDTIYRHFCNIGVRLQSELDVSTARRRLKSPRSLFGTPAQPAMVTQVNITVMNGWLASFSFIVNRLPHSWDKAISDSKVKVMGVVKGQGHTIGPVSYQLTSFSFNINQTNNSADRAISKFDLETSKVKVMREVKGQGHI